MRSRRFVAIFLPALAALMLSSVMAQNGGSAPAASRFVGEKLVFEGKIARLKISMAIADLIFTTSPGANANEISIKAEAMSKGTMLKLFRYSFLQEYESVVDLTNFRILKTTKNDVQKQRVRESEALFDYSEKRVRYVETDPKDSNRPPRRIASEISNPMNDMISAIYALRLRDLKVGDRVELSVSDSGLVYKVPAAVTKRERISSPLGKIWCLRVEPEIFGPGRLIEQKGKMILWLSDNARRIPIRAQVDSQYGKVDIRLKSAIGPD